MSNFLDTFTGTGLVTAHTSDSGHTWTDLGLGVGINGANSSCPALSGGLLTVTGNGNPHYWSGQPSWTPGADQSFSVRFINDAAGTNNYGIVGVRCADGASPTGYIFEFDGFIGSDVQIYVYAYVAGAVTFDLNGVGAQPYTVADPTDVTIEARAVGSTISLWLDGVMAWSATDTLILTGGTGFIALDPGNTHPTYMAVDEIIGTDLSVAPSAFWTEFVRTREVDA